MNNSLPNQPSTNTTNEVVRPLIPFALVTIAYFLPIAWGSWGIVALGSSQTIAGVPEYLAVSWLGLIIGMFSAGVCIYIVRIYKQSGLIVQWQHATTSAAILYLISSFIFSGWLYVQFTPKL